jgi:FAD/FMN-containing dehydrogenase
MTTRTPTAPPAPAHLPTVVQPLHGAYDEARHAWNLAADQRPAGIVTARTGDEVRDAVLFARQHGLKVVPQSTGHLAAALPSLENALLVRTDMGDDVTIDADARIARVGAGALWKAVADAAAPHGLVAMHGSSPDVSVIGYSLGGGLSWLARSHGLAANHVTAIELVSAAGRLVRATAEQHADLFWALRGGGGNFGVVTAMEFRLFPLAEVFAGASFWPIDHAGAIVRRWAEWTRTAPEEATTSLRLLNLPPLPDVPEPLRSVPVVAIDGVIQGDARDALELVKPLLGIAEPILEHWDVVPAPALVHLHGDPEEPVPVNGHHTTVGELTDDAIDTFIAASAVGQGPLLMSELRHLGGAVARAPFDGGARGSMDAPYALFAGGIVPEPDAVAPLEAALDHVVDALEPWREGALYLNFAERGGSAEDSFDDPAAFERLSEIRGEWDPEEVLVASHHIPAR